MTRLQIVNNALRRMGEGTSPAAFGGTTAVISGFNKIKRAFETDTRIFFGTAASVTFTANNRTKAVATAMFHVVHARYRGSYLSKSSMEELLNDEQGSTWISATGVPESWYVAEGHNNIGLYPIPAASYGGTLICEGYKTSPDLSADGSVPSLPPQYHDALEDGLVVWLCELDADNSRNAQELSKAMAGYQKYVRQVAGEKPSRTRLVVHESWGR